MSRPTVASLEEGSRELDFVQFFRAEYPGLLRALYVLTANRYEAEELAQDAMTRAFERWGQVRSMASPGAYVYRTAVNLNRKRLRRIAVRTKRALALVFQSSFAGGPEVKTELDWALASLPRGQREAFMLVEWVGLRPDEAARVLGIETSSVRSRIHRARATLRERLEGGVRD